MSDFSIEAITYVMGERAIPIRIEFPEFVKVIEKTGIETVHQTATSAIKLAEFALVRLIEENPTLRRKVGALIFVTQSPVNYLPSGACVLQELAGLPSTTMAFDVGQGCSGFVQALALSARLIADFKNVVIVCADTYRSKIDKCDRSTSAVFSDAASAIWISDNSHLKILAESHYSDGSGAQHLSHRISNQPGEFLKMSGADVYLWTKRIIPREIENVMSQAQLKTEMLDFVFFHQASQLVLESLSRQLSAAKLTPSNIKDIGNTTSSSIPILMAPYVQSVNISRSLLSGFGVGLSASTLILGPSQN